MDFDALLEYCNKLNESTNEKCLICHIPINNSDSHIILECKHYYHTECIGYKEKQIKCMYCEKTSKPNLFNHIQNTCTGTPCKHILLTGVKKGGECGRVNCNYHNKVKEELCTSIVKSKNTVCNRKLPCKYHKTIII